MNKMLYELPLISEPLSKNDFGGKASSLNFLIKNNIRVPKTFVLSTDAHRIFLEHNHLQPFHFIAQSLYNNDDNFEGLREVFKNESLKYINAKIPELLNAELNRFISSTTNDLFAIRSSANCEDNIDHAWAGQFNSFLNTPKSAIKERVKSCFASVFSAGVFYYALRHSSIDRPIEMAVVIQEMVPADISGVCFTVNPISNDSDQIMIEFCEGLGEPLVSSQIIPHMYLIKKSDSSVIKYRHGNQKRILRYGIESNCTLDISGQLQQGILSKLQLQLIVAMAKKLEELYGHAQDFEWVFAGDELNVVQSRNITT